MKRFQILTSSLILGSVVLASCSTNKLASTGAQDNMYFMASDARVATEYAVQNNNPDQFRPLANAQQQNYSQENFSSRNVNPDYISRYQAEPLDSSDQVVYFDENGAVNEAGDPDINVYNNYYVNSGMGMNGFNPAFNMGFMGGFSPWGMGGFYDPFWGPGFGFRPGFNMSIGFGMGFGFGNPFFRRGFYGGFNPWGMGGFYDPFWGPGYAFGGYPGFGWGNPYFGRPIYVLPGGEYGDRRVVRGSRPTRGATLAGTRAGVRNSNAAVQPSTARAQARRDAMNNGSNSGRRLVSNSASSRTTTRDFSSSQNDYYNSNARTVNPRNTGSAAMDRSTVRTRSAMPSARPSVGSTPNSRNAGAVRNPGVNNRTSNPSYNRSANPSYNNRGVAPARNSSPSYNRGNTNTRTFTPSRTTTPTRSTPSYSAPSRSSGGSIGGGGSRGGGGSSSGGSRGGRGN